MLQIDLDEIGIRQPDGTFILPNYDPDTLYTSKNVVASVFKKIDGEEYVFSSIALDPTYLDTKEYICVWSK